jgi:hypothetical protein
MSRRGEKCVQEVLPRALYVGVRRALDAGRGRLRMDPQELADRIGELIDLQVRRLAKIRADLAEKKRLKRMLAQPARYIAPDGTWNMLAKSP